MREMLHRTAWYYRQHGLASFVRRLFRELFRTLFRFKDIIYYLDLATLDGAPEAPRDGISVTSEASAEEIAQSEIARMNAERGCDLIATQLASRFPRQAKLWHIKSHGEPVGFVWTISRPIEHFYFPLGDHDVYVFDALIYPEHRGKGLLPVLLDHVLSHLKASGNTRVYLAVRQWNAPMLRSMEKTPFLLLGTARKIRLFRRDLIIWYRMRHTETLPLRRGMHRADHPRSYTHSAHPSS